MSGVTFLDGSWPPSPGLEPWEIFDLQLLRPRQVLGRDAEPGGCHLLDGGVVADAVDVLVPRRVLATLATVGGHAQPPKADGQRLVGLGAEGAQAHRGAHESAQDPVGGLDLGQVAGRGGPDQVQLVADGGGVAVQRRAIGRQRLGVIRRACGELLDRP